MASLPGLLQVPLALPSPIHPSQCSHNSLLKRNNNSDYRTQTPQRPPHCPWLTVLRLSQNSNTAFKAPCGLATWVPHSFHYGDQRPSSAALTRAAPYTWSLFGQVDCKLREGRVHTSFGSSYPQSYYIYRYSINSH